MLIKQGKTFINNFLEVSSNDPDDARRRKLLNILLLGVFVLTLLVIAIALIAPSDQADVEGTTLLYIAGFSLLLVAGVMYYVNRYWSGVVASSLFLLFLTIIFAFSDSPEEVANGRSLIFFAIPIITSSVLIRPTSSFVFALLSGIAITALALNANLTPNPTAWGGFFMLALVSWLSSRNLEKTLKELREVNSNLDQIAKERTQELSESLNRERIEAGRNQAILEGIADGVIVFDIQGSVIQANPAIIQLLGIPRKELITMTMDDFTRLPYLDAKSRGTLNGILTNPEQLLSNHRITWGEKELSTSSAQVHDNAGNIIGTVAVIRDFTKEAQVEEMKSTFLAIVSHELRTPLNAILGYAEMLKEAIYGPVNEKQASVSVRIMTNAQRLLAIVSDLLDQSQIEAGKLAIHVHPFNPKELISNAHDVMDKLAMDKGIIFKSEISTEFPKIINGDLARLQQIVVNLVANAIKFTEQGRVKIRLLCPEEDYWELEVRDNGQGIHEDEIPHIFDAFRQVEGAITREHGGFGLGLSIVKNLVALMGGEIDVESKVGIGSTFTVKFPLVRVLPEEK